MRRFATSHPRLAALLQFGALVLAVAALVLIRAGTVLEINDPNEALTDAAVDSPGIPSPAWSEAQYSNCISGDLCFKVPVKTAQRLNRHYPDGWRVWTDCGLDADYCAGSANPYFPETTTVRWHPQVEVCPWGEPKRGKDGSQLMIACDPLPNERLEGLFNYHYDDETALAVEAELLRRGFSEGAADSFHHETWQLSEQLGRLAWADSERAEYCLNQFMELVIAKQYPDPLAFWDGGCNSTAPPFAPIEPIPRPTPVFTFKSTPSNPQPPLCIDLVESPTEPDVWTWSGAGCAKVCDSAAGECGPLKDVLAASPVDSIGIGMIDADSGVVFYLTRWPKDQLAQLLEDQNSPPGSETADLVSEKAAACQWGLYYDPDGCFRCQPLCYLDLESGGFFCNDPAVRVVPPPHHDWGRYRA